MDGLMYGQTGGYMSMLLNTRVVDEVTDSSEMSSWMKRQMCRWMGGVMGWRDEQTIIKR